MEKLYAFMERLLLLSFIGFAAEMLLPKGTVGSSAKRALSLILLLYAAEPALMLLEAG